MNIFQSDFDKLYEYLVESGINPITGGYKLVIGSRVKLFNVSSPIPIEVNEKAPEESIYLMASVKFSDVEESILSEASSKISKISNKE